MTLKNGDTVVVEVDRGIDYGQVVADPVLVEQADASAKKIVRPAN
jgi:cell fate regulator YaaT (PSP1 superfamily)